MKFYSAWYCPFAQRVWMALEYKGIDFELIGVDPYDKTEEWLQISRGAALVPVLVQPNWQDDGVTTIVESNRILEYLDHFLPDKALLFAKDPNQRAEQKYWIDFIGDQITPFMYRFLRSASGQYRDESEQSLRQGLSGIAGAMDAEGPFFSGHAVSAVDLALIPFAYRVDVLLGHYRKFRLCPEDEIWPRYHRWYQSMLTLPAFKATAIDHDDYEERLIAHYLPYSQANESWAN